MSASGSGAAAGPSDFTLFFKEEGGSAFDIISVNDPTAALVVAKKLMMSAQRLDVSASRVTLWKDSVGGLIALSDRDPIQTQLASNDSVVVRVNRGGPLPGPCCGTSPS